MNRGTYQDTSIYSEHLQEEIELQIYLPYNYSPLYKYSFLIANDGSDYFKLGRLGRTADELIENDEIEELIIVGIPYKSVEDRRRKYHPEGEQSEAYLRFLVNELVPFLDEEYATFHLGYGRALIGDSLAATVALRAGLEYPRTFGKAILHSPYVDEDLKEKVENCKEPELLSIYHVIGTEETEVPTTDGQTKNFIDPNRELSNVIKERDFDYFYDEFEGGHLWKHWQPDMKRALLHMFKL
ncbi:alpha/beta hydrolase [Guptibacillus algicola]|uniref:alpha/beta hydrolase n=1 Tax=Guptibacillus algicola TaxID=225844 RepID=UPI001CD6E310|nr:alpha/beta hydrolase-fold protein [Alkalihalobacillus algicola]MCA0987870.1 esterase family protein [Alkalihalobacillus algicola]